MSISKKTRFEVFKRDNFACQYCGRTPPQVVLEPDHIDPKVNGGSNHIDNLITACFDCNRGKAGRLLTDIPQTLKDKAELIAEKELQIKGYNKILKKRADRLEAETWEVAQSLAHDPNLESYSRQRLTSIKMFLERLPFQKVLEASEYANSAVRHLGDRHFRYFCGTCWKMIREQENG